MTKPRSTKCGFCVHSTRKGGVRKSRHTRSGQRRTLQYPLEQSLLELQDDPEPFMETEQLPLDRVYPEMHTSQDPEDEQRLQLLRLDPLQQRLPCTKQSGRGVRVLG